MLFAVNKYEVPVISNGRVLRAKTYKSHDGAWAFILDASLINWASCIIRLDSAVFLIPGGIRCCFELLPGWQAIFLLRASRSA